MIEKLRRRMIALSMASALAVMLLLMTLINVFNYVVTTQNIDQTLFMLGEREQYTRPGDQRPNETSLFSFFSPKEGPGPNTGYFVVSLDESKEPASVFIDKIDSVDEASAVEYAQKALAEGTDKGYLDNFRYAISSYEGNTFIVFLDVSAEQWSMLTLFRISLLVTVAALALVFVPVFLLSKRMVQPFAQNLQQQQRFITDASHELKTPLTSIATSLDVLDLTVGEDEWLANIRSQTERLTKLVAELVALSRLDEARLSPRGEEFSVSDAAWETVEAFQARAAAQGKTLETAITEDLTVRGDRAAVQQMLSALLDNAVRYSDDGGLIRLTVEKKASHVVMEVYNTCHYETPPDTKKLFDRFYRPDESRNTETGGSGIGLSIAKAVMDAHGGTITAQCPDGTSMTIRATF